MYKFIRTVALAVKVFADAHPCSDPDACHLHDEEMMVDLVELIINELEIAGIHIS